MPESLIRGFEERHGIRCIQGWGMTETSPVGSIATLTGDARRDVDEDDRYRMRATPGGRCRSSRRACATESGFAPWDGVAMGELEVRGPWVVERVLRRAGDGRPVHGRRMVPDRRHREHRRDGYIIIRDRSKDVIKSGGEWISSVGLENKIMTHPAVLEAAVVGLRHPTWDERPLALVVMRPSASCTAQDILGHLEPHFPKFWMPSARGVRGRRFRGRASESSTSSRFASSIAIISRRRVVARRRTRRRRASRSSLHDSEMTDARLRAPAWALVLSASRSLPAASVRAAGRDHGR